MSLTNLLAHHIRRHGPIRTVRVSSAQSHTQYAYWGAVRYEIHLTRDGQPANVACERASSDRRSVRGAERDAAATGRLPLQTIGRLSEDDVFYVLAHLGYDEAIARHDARRPCLAPRPLTLRERVIVARLRRIGCQHPNMEDVVRRHLYERQQEATGAGRWYYVPGDTWRYHPYGDDRDAEEFRRSRNQEERRQIIRVCGSRVIPPAQEIQRDDYGVLLKLWNGDKQVRVVCPSTGAVYYLPVDRTCRTAHEAVAATFGLEATEYRPLVEA